MAEETNESTPESPNSRIDSRTYNCQPYKSAWPSCLLSSNAPSQRVNEPQAKDLKRAYFDATIVVSRRGEDRVTRETPLRFWLQHALGRIVVFRVTPHEGNC